MEIQTMILVDYGNLILLMHKVVMELKSILYSNCS